MMTVSIQLANGVLDIGFDGNKDDAVVAVVGNQLNVTSNGNTASFVLDAKYQDELDPAAAGFAAAMRFSIDGGSGAAPAAPITESKDGLSSAFPIFAKKFMFDTNGDGAVSPLDVLTIINHLNQHGGRSDFGEGGDDNQVNEFLDANSGGSVSPLNILTLINYQNSQSKSGEGEFAVSDSGTLVGSEEELLRTRKRLLR